MIVEAESQVNENKVQSRGSKIEAEEEVTSEPKGFFYSFEYPVDLLADSPKRRALKLSEHEGGAKVRRSDPVATETAKVDEVKVKPEVKLAVETKKETAAVEPAPLTAIAEGKSVTSNPANPNPKIILPPIVVTAQLKSTEKVQETEPQPQTRVSLKAVEEGGIPVDAVHDAQVHPKQKDGLVNSQLLPVSV